MRRLTVALLQIAAHGNDRAANLAAGEEACRRAAAMGADVALFPEMWSAGYTSAVPTWGQDILRAPELWPKSASVEIAPDRAWAGLAIDRDGPFVAHFRDLARELSLAIAITYLESWPGGPRNSLSLIDRHGAIVLTYAKVHTCDFSPHEAGLTPGTEFPVASLDTAAGPVMVGAMICYDREFPESARILMLGGAELILTPNACRLDSVRIPQFGVRAFENVLGAAMVNYPAPQENGHSVAFDGMAFDPAGRPRQSLIVEAGTGPQILLAPFDLDALRAYRRRETWGGAFRRPHRYAALTATGTAEPFVRVGRDGHPYDPRRR